MIFVIALFTQTVCVVVAADDVNAIVEFAFTSKLPDKVAGQAPSARTVKLKLPEAVGVPLMVNTPALYTPDTPAGNEPALKDPPVVFPPMA